MLLTLQSHINSIAEKINNSNIEDVLADLIERFPNKVTFSTSFSYEDQVIADKILGAQFPVSIFTLDTGRLFPETYAVWSATNEKYNTHIKAFYPDHLALQKFVEEKGPNSFYESVENRKACCFIRKVDPLKRALSGNAVWITGLRAEHSSNRQNMPQVEWDESNQIIKYHPVLYWTTEELKEYINRNDVPYNPLHDRGFVSIGCAPCTRAIRPGEDFRAGRWWWEGDTKKECGLHIHQQAENLNPIND